MQARLLFGAMCVVWGATWVASKIGAERVPPMLFAGSRFAVAGAVMLVAMRAAGGRVAIGRRHLGRLAAVTLLTIVATYGLLFWSLRFVPAGLAAILNMALMPLALLGFGAALGEDRFTRARSLGLALGAAGLVLLFAPGLLARDGTFSGPVLQGCAAILVSTATYAAGSVLSRPLLRIASPAALSGATMLGGGLVLVLLALLLEPGAWAAARGDWGLAPWLAWLFLVLLGSLFAYTVFLALVRSWGASRAGAYAFVSPAIAVLLGVAFFGERVAPVSLAAMAIMLAGAWLTLRPAKG